MLINNKIRNKRRFVKKIIFLQKLILKQKNEKFKIQNSKFKIL